MKCSEWQDREARWRTARYLKAAVELFAEHGIDATSMDAIADASGVSKATIYKHWPDKDALALEVMAHLSGWIEEPPVFDSGDFRADLIAQLQYEPAPDRKAMKERIMPHLIAYASRNQVFGMRVAGASDRTRADRAHESDSTRREEGILKRGIDPELGIALLLGPMIYGKFFLVKKLGKKPPENLEVHTADAFLALFGKK